MCGICGIALTDELAEVKPSLLAAMCRVLRHRGPDAEGIFLRGRDTGGPSPRKNVGFGHNRLSIIDLAGGSQPMPNEDRTIWVVFNGEIYNFLELRPKLEAAGHRFQSDCDTEAIIHLYEEKGEQFLDDLRGMFSLAIWDEKKNRLILARDRLGKKPMYYCHTPEKISFASEIKAILEDPFVPRRVDPVALDLYLAYQYVPYPHTMFSGINELPPGHWLIWQNGKTRIERYWKVDPRDKLTGLSVHETTTLIREVMTKAVELRLISDVPLGAFLSGGIDSTIVVGLMSRLSKEPVKTFSIGFEEKKYNELYYARIAASAFKTDHREFTVRPDAISILPQLIWHYDEPFADSSAIPTYYVSRMTAQHVKVALSGDGGDENFGGYPRYRAVKLARPMDSWLPRPIRSILAHAIELLPASTEQKTRRRRLKKFARHLADDPRRRYYNWIAIFNDAERQSLYSPEFAASLGGFEAFNWLNEAYAEAGDEDFTNDFVEATALVDLATYLPCDILRKVDVASMAHSLEVRCPFLDHKVVELAARIPMPLKLKGFEGKAILKQTFADLLPPEILNRGKMGFGVPVSRWFREELAGYLRTVVLSERSRRRGFFQPEALTQLVEDHVAGRADNGYKLWALLNLELWHRLFIDREDITDIKP